MEDALSLTLICAGDNAMQDYEEREVVSERDARLRNLLLSITRGILERNIEIDYRFSIDDISKWFYFRKGDVVHNIDYFFNKDKNGYYLNLETKKKIKKMINNHNQVLSQLESAKVVFLKTFGRLEREYNENSNFRFDFQKLRILYKEIKPIMPILHWGILPIISKYLMMNGGKIPEDDIIEFYDHFHMLQAMLKEIQGDGEIMTVNGDNNLDKEMSFSVYSRRWGHDDYYEIKRTIDGWSVDGDGKCSKDGEGALFKKLHHDSIFFPEEAVRSALGNLWEEAEQSDMKIEELQEKIQQVADWISSVEKVVGEKQPEWVHYYS